MFLVGNVYVLLSSTVSSVIGTWFDVVGMDWNNMASGMPGAISWCLSFCTGALTVLSIRRGITKGPERKASSLLPLAPQECLPVLPMMWCVTAVPCEVLQGDAAGQAPGTGSAGKQRFGARSCPRQWHAAGRPKLAAGNAAGTYSVSPVDVTSRFAST